MVTGPVGEHLQAGTEDAPVLDRPAPFRRLHDSGAGYKYPDYLLTYLLIARQQPTNMWILWSSTDNEALECPDLQNARKKYFCVSS